MDNQKLDVGIFGLWGMNISGVSFGGFETGFSEVAWRLAERGHKVTIYCRKERYPQNNRPAFYKGVHLVYVPSIDNKSLSFLSAMTTSLFHALRHRRHDVYLFANVGSGMHCLITRLLGEKVVLNVDGLDWLRGKWGWFARFYFQLAVRAALFACDALITDSDAMVDFYIREFGRELEMIAYGAYVEATENSSVISQFGVEPFGYFLIACRLVPENNIDLIVDAFTLVRTDKKLLIVGDANYESTFHQKIRNSGDPRIQFTGWINDQAIIKELHCNCYGYIHGHSVGGTNPALLKALGHGNLVLALNTPFNSEVLVNGAYGILWDRDIEDLRRKIQDAVNNPGKADLYRQKAPDRIREAYAWDRIVDQYEALLLAVQQGRSDSRRRIGLLRAGLLAMGLLVIGRLVGFPIRTV